MNYASFKTEVARNAETNCTFGFKKQRLLLPRPSFVWKCKPKY